MFKQVRVWTMIYADGKWRFRTPPQGPKAGFTSQPYSSRNEARRALLQRFNAVPTYYVFEVEREGRKLIRKIERRKAAPIPEEEPHAA